MIATAALTGKGLWLLVSNLFRAATYLYCAKYVIHCERSHKLDWQGFA